MTRARLLAGGLALALVAALVAVVLLWNDRDEANDRAEASAGLVNAEVAAEKAAREAVTRMTTYHFRTVDEDFAWVDDAGTEKFEENFTRAAEESVTLIKSLKARAAGTIVESSATAADAGHVKVLLFVDQEIRSQDERGVRLDQSRVTLQMVKQDGQWLVDEVELTNLLRDPSAG